MYYHNVENKEWQTYLISPRNHYNSSCVFLLKHEWGKPRSRSKLCFTIYQQFSSFNAYNLVQLKAKVSQELNQYSRIPRAKHFLFLTSPIPPFNTIHNSQCLRQDWYHILHYARRSFAKPRSRDRRCPPPWPREPWPSYLGQATLRRTAQANPEITNKIYTLH